ncbi:uncharacterized protein LOC144614576 [Panthera onca]
MYWLTMHIPSRYPKEFLLLNLCESLNVIRSNQHLSSEKADWQVWLQAESVGLSQLNKECKIWPQTCNPREEQKKEEQRGEAAKVVSPMRMCYQAGHLQQSLLKVLT